MKSESTALNDYRICVQQYDQLLFDFLDKDYCSSYGQFISRYETMINNLKEKVIDQVNIKNAKALLVQLHTDLTNLKNVLSC